MDTSHSILKSAKDFFAGTALSRLSGLFRDVAMAFCFGGAPEIAAFMVAYRLANLLRRVFGEGNLQSGFVPHFEMLRGESIQKALCFYRDSAFSLSLLLFFLVLGIEGVLWLLLGVLSSGWREIAELTMWMAPGLLFICLSALNSALLQCQKKYFAPAFAPVLFNGVWIAFALLSASCSIFAAIRWLSLGVTVAFAAQWIATAIQVRKEVRVHLDWKEWIRPHLFSPEWKKIIRPMALGVIGIGAMQINSALDAIFARIADLSGPTFLWYAIRVQQLPLALFGIAISGAVLPPLSRAMREGHLDRYKSLLSGALRQAAALMIPCAFGLFALGASGLNLLFGRGHFSSYDLRETLLSLWAYGIGVVPASFILLFAAGCYAKKILWLSDFRLASFRCPQHCPQRLPCLCLSVGSDQYRPRNQRERMVQLRSFSSPASDRTRILWTFSEINRLRRRRICNDPGMWTVAGRWDSCYLQRRSVFVFPKSD